MSNPQKRRHDRREANLVIRVQATLGDQVHNETSRMLDVSEGGLCYLAGRYVPPGTSVTIAFGECILIGEVRHCRIQEYGSHGLFVTGVKVQKVVRGQDSWTDLTQFGS